MSSIWAALNDLDAQENILAEKREKLIHSEQEACPHPLHEIVEGSYAPSGIIVGPYAPFRVCRRCGYAEEGWGCGYLKLAPDTHDIPSLPRDTAQKYVLKKLSQRQMNEVRYPGERYSTVWKEKVRA